MKKKRVNVCCIFTTLAQLKCSHLNKIKMKRRRKKNRQTPKHEEEITLTQFEFVRFCEELFRAHRNRRSIYCSENSSFGSLSWYAVMYNNKKKRIHMIGLVSFPNLPTAYHLIIIYYGILKNHAAHHTVKRNQDAT